MTSAAIHNFPNFSDNRFETNAVLFNFSTHAILTTASNPETATFEAVKQSMEQQRDRLRQSHGARDVDFQVVIKDGKAYLKPETKK